MLIFTFMLFPVPQLGRKPVFPPSFEEEEEKKTESEDGEDDEDGGGLD